LVVADKKRSPAKLPSVAADPAPAPTKVADGVELHRKQEQKWGVNVVWDGDKKGQRQAELTIAPGMRHAFLQKWFGENIVKFGEESPPLADSISALARFCEDAKDGKTWLPTQLLTSQMLTLDAVSTDLLRRAGMAESLEVFETMMRLALKAQASSRATAEALDKLMRGGKQVVEHLHVYRGGQAVVAGAINQHRHNGDGCEGEGGQNGK
jgi:hypothetical protein